MSWSAGGSWAGEVASGGLAQQVLESSDEGRHGLGGRQQPGGHVGVGAHGYDDGLRGGSNDLPGGRSLPIQELGAAVRAAAPLVTFQNVKGSS